MALTPPNPQTAATVAPQQVRAMLKDGGEMALLDVREEGVFSEQGHPFFANSVPLSRLELMIRDLVPRKLTRIVVYDAGPGRRTGRTLPTALRPSWQRQATTMWRSWPAARRHGRPPATSCSPG